MNSLQKILVPTDFSQESINGLKMAVGIASQMNASIHLLHIIDMAVPQNIEEIEITDLNLVSEQDLQHSEKVMLMKLLKETHTKILALTKEFGQVKIHAHVSFDRITYQINQFVEKHDISLIIMGYKGTSGNDSFLLGSNAEKVIRTAKVPVLTVKQAVKEVNIKNICFASDFKEVPKTAIDLLKKLQKIYGAVIHLVKIITPPNFEISSITHQNIKLFALESQLENYTINHYNYYTEYEGIISFAEEKKVDLISMTTQGNTGFIRMLKGSIAEDVANNSMLPVLTFNEFA
ncbi:MAG: universal stress protein [Cytophagales bacterium]|nr:MAG: universal stress protein [Cytophagales bacterium]